MILSIFGSVRLTPEEIQTVRDWINKEIKTKPFSCHNDHWIIGKVELEGEFNETMDEISIQIEDTGISFNQLITDKLYEEDLLFGLNKERFREISKNQKWRKAKSRFALSEPTDLKNCVITQNISNPRYSKRNRHILETEKVWKDRVYSIELLKELMEKAILSYEYELSVLLDTTSPQGEEYHQPISIKMILDHLNNPSITELINDILAETIKSNIIRKENLDTFINTVNQFKLKRDIEISGITAAYATSSDGEVTDIRDIPDAIEAMNGVTSAMKRENRLTNKNV